MTAAPAKPRLWLRLLVVSQGLLAAAVVVFFVLSARRPAPPLTDFGAVGPFVAVERNGSAVEPALFAGRVWLASFLYTRCEGPCPMIAANLSRLQSSLPADVSLVSFTVDPDHDTPSVLSAYAETHGAHERWLFASPGRDGVAAVRTAFKLPGSESHPSGQILHSSRVALVDRSGHLRAYFDGTDPAGVRSILPAVRALLAEPRR